MSETYMPSGAIGRPRTDREPITIRIGRKQRRWVDAQALAAQCGRSEIIRQLVQAAMDADEAEDRQMSAELQRCEP